MSDIVYVALISAGSALVAALMTQLFAMRAAAQLASRLERREELQLQRGEVKRKADLREARLREFWGLVLTAQTRMGDMVQEIKHEKQTRRLPFAETSTTAAGQAYAVALLGLPDLRTLSKNFYYATLDVQLALEDQNENAAIDLVTLWRTSFNKLESAVAESSDSIG